MELGTTIWGGEVVLLPEKMIFVESVRTIVFADLHLGLEYALTQQGYFIPPLQFNIILQLIKNALKKYKPKKAIILGDLKHAFHKRTHQEHKEIKRLIELLLTHLDEVILVRGNHDNFVRGFINRLGAEFIEDYLELGNYILLHGHKIISEIPTNKRTIFAHIHPVITLSDGITRERFPVFMFNEQKNKLVLPAMTPLLPGLDIVGGLSDKDYESPLLSDLENYRVFIVIDNKKVVEIK